MNDHPDRSGTTTADVGDHATLVRCLPCCTGCGACVAACPHQALSLESALPDGRGQKRAVVDATRCTGCGLCLPACPRQALVMPAPLWPLP